MAGRACTARRSSSTIAALRVGSGNLSNRSMGVDTECDLAVEAENEATRAGIAAFLGRLPAARRFRVDGERQ